MGTTALEVLEAIAAFPYGVEECRLESILPSVTGAGAAVDVLCKFSLLYRQDGFVRMLSPLRFYFLDSALVEATHHAGSTPQDAADCISAQARTSLSLRLCYTHRVTLFEESSIYTRGNTECCTPRTTSRSRARLAKENWIRRFQSTRRGEHDDSDSFVPTPITISSTPCPLRSLGLAPICPGTIVTGGPHK